MKELKILALVVSISAFSFAQSINVTFQVDMSYQIFAGNFPDSANVVVRGNFQTDAGDPNGNWQGNLFQLSDADDDTIYTGTFPMPGNFVGTNYAFKYVIVNPPAGDDWESTPERQFTLNPPQVINPIVYFEDDHIFYDTIVTNTINFTADISSILGVGIDGAFDPNQDSLLVMGLDWEFLGQDVTGNRRMINLDPFNLGIYTTTLSVTSTAGILENYNWNDSTNWKFKAYPDSRFQNDGWETGGDRWHVYVADGSIITLPAIVPRIYPNFGQLSADLDLTIYVDMLLAVNRYNGLPIPLNELEFVGIRGTEDFLGNVEGGCWCVNDTSTGHMKVLTNIGNNIWRYHTIVPAGTSIGLVEYRLGAMYPGADTINGGNSPLDNGNDFGSNRLFLLTEVPSIQIFTHFTQYDGVGKLDELVPTIFQLEQNYPNPFNPSTKIRYSIPEYSSVTLKVFNLLGEEIETLVNSEQSAGVYEATFDASNLASGIYFYTLQTDNFSSSKKMILIK
jgi:hypothetical protein